MGQKGDEKRVTGEEDEVYLSAITNGMKGEREKNEQCA